MNIAISERFNNPLSYHYERSERWREEKRKLKQKQLNSRQQDREKQRKNSYDGADFYDDVLAIGAALLGATKNWLKTVQTIRNGMMVTYGGTQYVAHTIHVSKAFNNLIDQKLSYEKKALTRIAEGSFHGPLPQEQHHIRSTFNGTLPKEAKQKLASLRGFVECNGECYLTKDGLENLGTLYKEAAAENGSKPVFIFREILPTTTLNPQNRRVVNEGEPALVYAHA